VPDKKKVPRRKQRDDLQKFEIEKEINLKFEM
jgi:hypothetical protein